MRYDFASDNTAGVAPEAEAAWLAANRGHAASYGADATTRRAADLIRALLDADAEVHFVATGTAANGIALAALCKSMQSVISHEYAHIRTDEAGAPAFFGHGIGLLPLPGPSGRIEPHELNRVLRASYSSSTQAPAVLSIANATELGTIYREPELRQLLPLATAAGLTIHLDGARLAHAAAEGFNPWLLSQLDVDVLVLGGSKTGMPASEAIVLLNKQLAPRFETRLKQAGHLWSKSRFLAAPWIGMLESGAWLHRSAHANAMARRLAASMPFPLAHPVETNAVFVRMDDAALAYLHRCGWAAFRLADAAVRFMCSWATEIAALEELIDALRDAAEAQASPEPESLH